MLLDSAEQARSVRDAFLRRTDAAGIMVDSGMGTVALPILEEMAQLIEHHHLEDWEEAEIVARALALLYRSRLASGEEAYAVQDLYQQVCRLDPIEGMKLSSQGASSGSSYAEMETSDAQPEEDSGMYGDANDQY